MNKSTQYSSEWRFISKGTCEKEGRKGEVVLLSYVSYVREARTRELHK
jgi:hypothetical protein